MAKRRTVDPPPPPALPDPPVEAALEGELPTELAQSLAITGRIPAKTREQMRAFWWRTYAPLFAAIGRGDLIPRRRRVWRTNEAGDLALVSDEVIEETPTLETRARFSEVIVKLGFDAEVAANVPLPQMAPLVWDLSREQQSTPGANTPLVQGLMEMAKQTGRLQ